MQNPSTPRNNQKNQINKRGNSGKNSNTHLPTEVEITSLSGPIPHPAILQKYEEIVPGAAERILAMAESDMRHQQQYDNNLLRASKSHILLGQILGFLIGIAALGASVYAAILGYPWLAGLLGGTTVVGLVTAFVIGRLANGKG